MSDRAWRERTSESNASDTRAPCERTENQLVRARRSIAGVVSGVIVDIVYLSVSAPATHTPSSSVVGAFEACAVLTMMSRRVSFKVPGVMPKAERSRSKGRLLRNASAR
jgi:hypothetical protein